MAVQDESSVWLPVIGKCLAYLCLQKAQISDRPMLEKAKFLEGLGVSKADAAGVLGTTLASLSELERQARKKLEKGKRGGAKK